MNAPRTPFAHLAAAQQAGILCNDPSFQKFAAMRSGFPGEQFATGAAAEYLRQQCRIDSRVDLSTDAEARERFQRLRTVFDAWRGRIAADLATPKLKGLSP